MLFSKSSQSSPKLFSKLNSVNQMFDKNVHSGSMNAVSGHFMGRDDSLPKNDLELRGSHYSGNKK